MAFPRSLKTNYVVKSFADSGVHSSNLHPFELAIIDANTYTSLTPANAVGKEVRLAVGSPNQGQAFAGLKVERLHDQLNTNISFKSQPITSAKQILTQKFTKDDKVNVYYLGWNGLNNACKALEFECGKTYQFDLYVKGREVRNIFGREMRDVIEFTTPCCDCSGTDCDTSLNCGLYVDQLVAKFNDPNRWLSRFFKAEAVVNCNAGDPLYDPTTEDVNLYCLTVCDNGDELALADVQAQYPDFDITVKERNAPFTTYQLYDVNNDGTPTPFTSTPTILRDCECPSGYTEVAGQDVYNVSVDSLLYNDYFDTDAATTLETMLVLTPGDLTTDGTVTLLSEGADQLVFQVSVVNGVSLDSVVPYGIVATLVGTNETVCTSGTTTTGWVLCDTLYKVYRNLEVTVKIPDCPSDTEASASIVIADWATYCETNGITDSEDENVGDCIVTLRGTQLSNEWLSDGCDTQAGRQAKWDIIPPFMGNRITSTVCEGYTVNESTGCVTGPEADTDCCQCGIKFTAHDFRTTDDLLGAPIYDINEYLEKDAVELTVSLLVPDGQTQVCSDEAPDWWQAQRATFRTLQGRDVLKEVIMERFYRDEPYFNLTDKLALLINKREGIKYGVDLDAYYFAITLSHNVANEMNWTGHNHSVREDVVLFVHEDDAATYNTIVNNLRIAFPNATVKSLNP